MRSIQYTFREVQAADEGLLWEMLYLAIYVPPGTAPPPRDVVSRPELARYVEGWGRPGDLGIVASEEADGGRPIGAAWLRLWSAGEVGYGFVALDTPELSIAILPNHRGRGVGTQLLQRLLARADTQFARVSLSVTRGNPAQRLYERLGFVALPVCATAASSIMVRTSAATVGQRPARP